MDTLELKSDIVSSINSEFPNKGEALIEKGVDFEEEPAHLSVFVIQSPLKPFELYEKAKGNKSGISLNELRQVGMVITDVAKEYGYGCEFDETDEPNSWTGRSKIYVIHE